MWETQWFQIKWCDWPVFAGTGIAKKELLPIIVAVAVWGRCWVDSSVLCHCDIESVLSTIRRGVVRIWQWHTLRCLFFLEARFNISLSDHEGGQ